MRGALVVLIVLGWPTTARAWNPQGHMMVAALAWEKLEVPVRGKVAALLRANPDYARWVAGVPAGERDRVAFQRAANWADDIREKLDYGDDPQPGHSGAYRDRNKHKDWHYINIPLSIDGTPPRDPPVPNVRTQIAALRRALGSERDVAEQSYALVWLLHLVADVHQPLHTVARFSRAQPQGDRGGTWVALCREPCRDHLHGFWDGVLGNGLDPGQARAQAAVLPAPDPALAAVGDENRWVEEGVQLAKQHVYRAPVGPGAGPYTLDDAYARNARAVAAQRVALAGARLARLINEALRSR
jgi:hypothetical protein